MELHLLDIFGAHLWTLAGAILVPVIAAIATFVCLHRERLSHKLLGFLTVIPLYIAFTVIICADTGGFISRIWPSLGLYPIIGFLASLCFATLCLNSLAVTCGTGALKRKGAVVNTVACLISFGINAYLTYSAWVFAADVYASKQFRNDAGKIDIKDALPFLNDVDFIPEAVLDSGIEIPVLAVFIIFLIVYFLSFLSVKSCEEMVRDDIERRRRDALAGIPAKNKKHAEDGDDDLCECCAYCEHAEPLQTHPMKMLCRKNGVVASSHVCRKYVYDPLKRKTFRPRISPLNQSDNDTM